MNDDKPIYLQIIEIIEDDIISGVYKANDIIISTTQISKLYSINPTTAMKAISILSEKGLLYKKRGIGMLVTETAKYKILQERKIIFFNQSIELFINQAKKLGITHEDLAKIILEKNKGEKNPDDKS